MNLIFQFKKQTCPSIEVRFSPHGGFTQSVVEGIEKAKHEICVQAFSFTSIPIATALINAKHQNKNVEVVLDVENLYNKNSVIKSLYENGITIYIDDKHAIAHNKILIIDKIRVFTGSANLTNSAEERNAENSISITDEKVAQLYVSNFNSHKDHSYLYSPGK